MDPTQLSEEPPVVKDYIQMKCGAKGANGYKTRVLLGTVSISFQSFYSSMRSSSAHD